MTCCLLDPRAKVHPEGDKGGVGKHSLALIWLRVVEEPCIDEEAQTLSH